MVNPKHQRKQIVTARQQQFQTSTKSFKIRRRSGYMIGLLAIIGLSTIIGIIMTQTNLFNSTVLEEDDTAYVEYKLWVADVSGEDGVIDPDELPYQHNTINFTFTEGNLLPVFHDECMGMKEGQSKLFELDWDEAYPAGTDLALTKLLFWVRIVEIYKFNDTTTE